IAEPQSPQNHFSAPSSGFQALSRSSPVTMRNDPGTTAALAEAAVPVRRWQRVQWQYRAEMSGSVTSKRTAPQLHPPLSLKSPVLTPVSPPARGRAADRSPSGAPPPRVGRRGASDRDDHRRYGRGSHP